MSLRCIILLCQFGILLDCRIGFSQTNTSGAGVENENQRVLFEDKSIKLVTGDDFPENMACDIYVGESRDLPWFSIKGSRGRVDDATLRLFDGRNNDKSDARLSILDKGVSTPSVSVMRRETEHESYVLYFFSHDSDGKIFGLVDLNLDGTWDVKKTPTRQEKEFILIEGAWNQVERTNGLQSPKPTAVSGARKFEFDELWKLSDSVVDPESSIR